MGGEGDVLQIRKGRAEAQAEQAELDQANQVAEAAGAAAPALKAIGGMSQQ